MKEVLQTLSVIPGVRMVALISEDGVPIVSERGASFDASEDLPIDQDNELNSFTALASGWLGEIRRATARLSWSQPRRVVMRASKNDLVLLQAPGAVVLAVLERGASSEELRVPMEGVLARMQRILRGPSNEGNLDSAPKGTPQSQPPGALPGAVGPDQSGAFDTLATNGLDPTTD